MGHGLRIVDEYPLAADDPTKAPVKRWFDLAREILARQIGPKVRSGCWSRGEHESHSKGQIDEKVSGGGEMSESLKICFGKDNEPFK